VFNAFEEGKRNFALRGEILLVYYLAMKKFNGRNFIFWKFLKRVFEGESHET
jgi:hypothetical protein